jgi:hypothetical protein
MRYKTLASCSLLAFAVGICGLASPVHAGTKYQTTLVPGAPGTTPGFSSSGSSIKIDGKRQVLKGKIKNVVDALGARITTDGVPSSDDYSVEVDLSVGGTVVVPFDLKNGNGKFVQDLTATLSGAALGDGVAVTAVRVKDDLGTVIGNGGVAVGQ